MKKPFKDELGRNWDKNKKSLIRNGQATFDLMGCGERGKLIPGLFEIRVEDQGNIYRIFCCMDEGNLVILFNGFQKKTQKTPRKEIETATRIMKEYFDNKKKLEDHG